MATTSIDPNNVILDPSTGLLIPSGGEAALLAQLGKNALAAPFAAGLELRRGATNERLGQQTAGNNALRSELANRIAASEFQQARFDTTASNLDKISDAGGRDFAVGLLGEEPTGFSTAATAVDLAGLQAGAAETAADAALAGAQAGLRPRSSDAFQDVTGFNVEEVTPLGLAEANVQNQLVTQRLYDPATNSFYDIKLHPDQIPAHIRERTASAAAGTATGETIVPQDTAQAQAVDNIKRRVARDGGEFLSPPRQIQLSDGTNAIEYHVKLADGSEFLYYAAEGNSEILGRRVGTD